MRKSVHADCWAAGINTGQVALETWERPSVRAESEASLSGNSKCSIKGQAEQQPCGNRSWVFGLDSHSLVQCWASCYLSVHLFLIYQVMGLGSNL